MNTFLDLSAKVGLSHCPEFPNTKCNQREKWKDPFSNESHLPFWNQLKVAVRPKKSRAWLFGGQNT